MALRKVSNRGSGVYFTETDLTLAVEAAGTFAGAAIALTEKGPAFEIMQSATFAERSQKLGGLNPAFPSSYYAKQFLEQAQNYKEVRMLGFEGYKDTLGFVIMYKAPGTTAAGAVAGVSPVIADQEAIACVLKPRRVVTDGGVVAVGKDVVSVEVASTPAPTDEQFTITLTMSDASTLDVICSLRPDSKEYIGKIFGYDPLDKTTVAGQPAGLWVEFIIPSVKQKATSNGIASYYYPGDIGNVPTPTSYTSLDIVDGIMNIDLTFTYPTLAITGATNTNPIVISAAGHAFVSGDLIEITSVLGNTAANGTFYVGNPIAGVSFELFSDSTLTTPVAGSGVYTSGGTVRYKYVPTWEQEVLELGGQSTEIVYQTPITPWFVSDVNANGEVKRLFRCWSISDGEAANTEIKLEIANINPAGKNGIGTFDIYVRSFDDQEDTGKNRLEGFTNLCLDPTNDDYVLKRIGDGENFELRSRYFFIEMNEDEVLPTDALPYGVEGYANLTGLSMPDITWTTNYNFSKSLNKQTLGLANNNLNMFSKVYKDYLSFKNVADIDAVRGTGFHLNPLGSVVVPADFVVVDPGVYQVNPQAVVPNTNDVTPSEKVRRSNYVVAFFGGFDAWDVYKTRAWADTQSKDFASLTSAVEILADRESIDADFSVLVTPDINFQEHSAATELVLEMVQAREDALYIFDFRYDIEADPQQAADDLSFSNMKTSQTATYFPHVQIEDGDNKVNVWLPASIIALATIAATAVNEQVWQPPAGSLRTISSNLVRTRRRMKVNDREILKGANINPITLFPGSGFEITESRTTQEFFSALSFVHNRLLLGYAKKALNQTLRPLLHQLNGTSISRNAFVTTVTPIFDRIKKLNGLEEFKVVVLNEQDDRTTLNCQIEIVPLYPIERIIVDFRLVNNTLEFSSPTT